MANCSKCGMESTTHLCPRCGDSPTTRRKVNRALIKYSYAVLAGLLGILIANHYFPLLDRNVFLIAGVCVLFAPVIFHLISSVRRRLGQELALVKRAYVVAGVISILLALVIAGNGAFDRSAATPVTTLVISKQVVRGRYGPSYTLKVRSWRAKRETESIDVNARTYGSTLVGKAIVLEAHKGVFGLPWYSGIRPE